MFHCGNGLLCSVFRVFLSKSSFKDNHKIIGMLKSSSCILNMITMILHFKGHLPVVVEKDEDGFFVVECPILKGCYTQGETLDEALKNINEVVEMCVVELD